MRRSREAQLAAALLAMLSIGLGAVPLYPSEAEAQLRDPPLGWDMWDPGWTQRDTWRPERMDRNLRWRMTRHWAFMQDGVPAAYRGAQNPMPQMPDVIP